MKLNIIVIFVKEILVADKEDGLIKKFVKRKKQKY
jgi:hypothetical protein